MLINTNSIGATHMPQQTINQDKGVIEKLLSLEPDWLTGLELLLYFWKTTILKEEGYGLVEELDFVNDKITPKIETFLVPEDIRAKLYNIIYELKVEKTGKKINLLNFLKQLGLINSEEVDRVLRCPVCGSYRIRTRLACPNCKSYKVSPTRLIQHTICGYTAPEVEFVTEEGKKKCPSCGLELKEEGIDYTIFGRIFYCDSCKRMFKTPQVEFICENADTIAHEPGLKFSPIDAKYNKLHKYYMSSTGIALFENGKLIIEALKKYVASLPKPIEIYEEALPEEPVFVSPEIKKLGFTLILKNKENNNLVVIDFAGKDAVPYVMKATMLKEKPLQYIIIGTQTTIPQLLNLELYADNIHIEDLGEHTFHSLFGLIESFII